MWNRVVVFHFEKVRFDQCLRALCHMFRIKAGGRVSGPKKRGGEKPVPKARNYDRENEQAARVILTDPAKYGGLPLIWAELWIVAAWSPAKEGGPEASSPTPKVAGSQHSAGSPSTAMKDYSSRSGIAFSAARFWNDTENIND
jgi:hypothetical protein